MATVATMDDVVFESHLVREYGPDCYALKVLRAEQARREEKAMKAKIKLKPVEEPAPVPAPVPESVVTLAVVPLDLGALGAKWASGRHVWKELRAAGKLQEWKTIQAELVRLGYRHPRMKAM